MSEEVTRHATIKQLAINHDLKCVESVYYIGESEGKDAVFAVIKVTGRICRV